VADAVIEVLNHTSVLHSRKAISSTSFLLQGPSQVSGDRHEGGAQHAGYPVTLSPLVSIHHVDTMLSGLSLPPTALEEGVKR
jgi:hypothetical protein